MSKTELQGLADSVTRMGGNFSNLKGSTDQYIKQLRASTPENLRFASSIAGVTKNFEDGKISSKEAADRIQYIRKQMDAARPATEKFKESFISFAKNVAIAATTATVAIVAFKKAYDFSRKGAELDFTISKFDRLAESIGTSTKALLNDLKKATDGTMSDMKLMATATDFMTLGLANSREEVIRLSSVSSQLGMNMNQLVLALTNRTTARFDQLGLSVAGFDEKVKALEKSGLSVEAAFTEAFLQQAEEQIAKVGSVTNETLGTFMRFEAAIENITVVANRKFSPAVAGIVETLTEGLTVQESWIHLLDDVNAQVKSGKISYDDYRLAVNKVMRSTGVLIDKNGELFANTGEGIIKLGLARKNVVLLSESQVEAAKYTAGWTEENYKAYHGIYDVDKAVQDLIASQAMLKQTQMDYKVFLSGELGKELKNFEEKTKNIKDEQIELNGKIDELEKKKYLTKAQKEELEELKLKQGELQGAIKATAEAHEIATKRILLGYMEQQMGIDGLSQKEQDVLMAVAEKWGLIDDATLRAWEGMRTYTDSIDNAGLSVDELAEKLANIEKNIKIDVWLQIHGLEGLGAIATMGGGGGGGGKEKQESKALGGGVKAGQMTQWGEYGRPEMFITPSSGQVVNAQQIVEAMRSSGVEMGGKGGVTIQQQTIYTNTRADLIEYSIERAKGYAL